MRILTVSNLYPPIVEGGYEARCAATVESLRGTHEVLVLTSDPRPRRVPAGPSVLRELPFLSHGNAIDPAGADAASEGACEVMRTAMRTSGRTS